MFRGTISLPAPIGSIKSVRLEGGKTITGRVISPVNSPIVTAIKSDRGEWLITGSASRSINRSTRISRSEPQQVGPDYPFVALALFGESGVWKGKDNNNKNLLDLSDNTDIYLAGIVNLGKKKFIADWIDYGADRIYRHENGGLLNFPLDYNFPPAYYGGGFHGWLLSRYTYFPEVSIADNQSTPNSRNYSRTRTETGTGHTRTYNASSTYSGSISPSTFTVVQLEGNISRSIASSGNSSLSVSDNETRNYPILVKTGIVGSEQSISVNYSETRSLSLAETASASQSYTHVFGYIGSSPFYGDSYGTPDSFSISYSLDYSRSRERETDTGEIEIEVVEGVAVMGRYLDRLEEIETESTGAGTISIATASGLYDWTESIDREETEIDFRITEYFRGVDGLAFYNKFNRERSREISRSSTGKVRIQFQGYLGTSVQNTENSSFPPPIGNNFGAGTVYPNETHTTLTVNALPGSGGTITTTRQVATAFDNSIVRSRPLEKKNANTPTRLNTIHEPSFLASTASSIDGWPFGEFGSIEGVYLADSGTSIPLSTDNSFFFRITNASTLAIPSLPATIAIPSPGQQIDLRFQRYSIGRDAGMIAGLIGFQEAIVRQPTGQIATTTYIPQPGGTSSVTRTASATGTTPIDPAWENMNGAAIGFVRWEEGKLYLYEGTLSIAFADTWLSGFDGVTIPQYRLLRAIASCALQLETKRPIKYFCHASIDPNTFGWVFSRDNCLGLIRTYLARENRRASLYRKKGVYFAFAEPIEAGDIRKNGELWVDQYRFDGAGNFLRDREEKGAISGLNGGGEVIGSIPISYYP